MANKVERLTMETKHRVKEHIDIIGKLFPNTLTEVIKGYNPVGDPIIQRAIDFDILKQELSEVLVEGPAERYQMNWPDKRKSILLANTPTNMTLRPCREESVDFDSTENLYIEGNNLEVLKLLQETYLNKVKIIYIDPPYNTGNDSFVYDDNFKVDSQMFSEMSGKYDEEGNIIFDIKENNESNGRFHTDWLNMIYPRIKLAKDLLREDGIMFISIDDNEVENVKKLVNEIFGCENHIGTYIKQSKVGGGSDTKFIVKEHEYCLVYCKSIQMANEMFIQHDENYLKRYKEADNEGRFFWDTFARPGLKNPIIYDIEAPDGTKITNGWIRSKERFERELSQGKIRIIKKPNGEWSVQFKQYLNKSGKKPRSMTMDFGGSIEGKNDISQLFSNEKIFSYPKSVNYIKTLIETIGETTKEEIIMDFFSGSATTAHAVMKANAEDGGTRKFIMIQLPETTSEKSEAAREGYENICEIGKERIRRAGKKIKQEYEEVAECLDIGFRVLKLDSSNMKDIYYKPNDYSQEMLGEIQENIKADRTSEDLLFQVMLELGELLSSSIEESTIGGKKVFTVGEGNIIACFDTGITEEVVIAIAKRKPYYAIFRDSSIATDSVAANFEQIFETYSPTTIRKVL